jgi:hypothetical protein
MRLFFPAHAPASLLNSSTAAADCPSRELKPAYLLNGGNLLGPKMSKTMQAMIISSGAVGGRILCWTI